MGMVNFRALLRAGRLAGETIFPAENSSARYCTAHRL
jgi:hypothetical protein